MWGAQPGSSFLLSGPGGPLVAKDMPCSPYKRSVRGCGEGQPSGPPSSCSPAVSPLGKGGWAAAAAAAGRPEAPSPPPQLLLPPLSPGRKCFKFRACGITAVLQPQEPAWRQAGRRRERKARPGAPKQGLQRGETLAENRRGGEGRLSGLPGVAPYHKGGSGAWRWGGGAAALASPSWLRDGTTVWTAPTPDVAEGLKGRSLSPPLPENWLWLWRRGGSS